MQRLKAMLKTTSVRLSMLFLVLFVFSATALVFYVSAVSEGLLQAQTERSIQRELRGVRQAYQSGGINSLMRYIERRSRQPGANLFVIAAPTGEFFAGNVSEIEPGVFDQVGKIEDPFEYKRFGGNDDESYSAVAHIMRLPNGMKLLVGRDLDEPGRFSELIRQALIMALTSMGVGALIIWFFVGRSALKRIDHMTMASEKIMAGDLAQRLPVSGSGDEFDRMSQSLNTMLGRIEQLNEGLRQVSDNIAHDLKTPLTRLRNRAEATLASDASKDDYRDALEDMISESDQLIRIFSALLMISRVEAGASAAKLSELDLSAVTRDAAELYEPVAEDSGFKLVSEIDDGIKVHGNRELIGQTLTNLIDNATKYASELETGRDMPTIWVKLAKKGKMLHLTVADNGPGIPEEKYGEVVKRFVRLDKSRNMPGTGLGLSLVEAVMRLHGGELKLSPTNPDNKKYPGLSVSLIFPAKLP